MVITTIQIKEKTWKELRKRKRLGETFDEVLNRLLLEEPEIKKVINEKRINPKRMP